LRDKVQGQVRRQSRTVFEPIGGKSQEKLRLLQLIRAVGTAMADKAFYDE
jgi:hypothetical protein